MTQGFLNFHIGGNLIDGHVARSFNHNLHVLFPGTKGKLTQGDKLLNL